MFPRNLSSVAANIQLGLGESDPRNVMQKRRTRFQGCLSHHLRCASFVVMVDGRTKRTAYAYRGAETGTKTAAVLNESHSLNYERNRFFIALSKRLD